MIESQLPRGERELGTVLDILAQRLSSPRELATDGRHLIAVRKNNFMRSIWRADNSRDCWKVVRLLFSIAHCARNDYLQHLHPHCHLGIRRGERAFCARVSMLLRVCLGC